MDNLVSVIVPVYKVEKYLDRCIESIVNQSYTNLEIILIDDGSPDNCPKMCDDWAQKDNRITVIHQENGGLSSARNVGIDKSTGEYICFVDSDDYVHKDFVKALMDQIVEYNSDIACVGYKFTTGIFIEAADNIDKNKIEVYNDNLSALRKLLADDGLGNAVWNKIYSRTLWDDIKFPLGRKLEDLGILYLILEKCNKITFNSNVYYYYFQRDDSIMHRPNTAFFIDYYELALERYNYINNKYGYIYDNERYTTGILMYCLSFLNEEVCDKSTVLNTLDGIYKNNKKAFARKDLVKYYILKFDFNTYCCIFSNYSIIKKKIKKLLKKTM